MHDQRSAILTIPEHDLIDILKTRILFPPGVTIGDMMWQWDQGALKIELNGDMFPVVPEGCYSPDVMVTGHRLDTGYWWFEVESE